MEFHGIEKLQGAENWSIWKFAVKNLLRGAEGAYEVCTGELEKPEALKTGVTTDQLSEYQAKLKAWDKADRTASQIIVKTLEAKVMALLVVCESAREMWLKLHSVYEQQTKQASHTVQAEFFSFSKSPTDDMVIHIAKFEGLILRMQQLNVKPDESSLMVKLLDSLPDDYESLRQAWWARPDEQQTFINLVGVLTSDEKRRQQRAEKQNEMVALVASTGKSQGKFIKREQNTWNNKNAQLKKTGESRTYKAKTKEFKCYKCGGKGHFRRDCPSVKQKNQNSTGISNGANNSDEAFICEIMNAENISDMWIVDSGATDHVSHHREWFSSFEDFDTPIKIHIGDQSTMDALGKGTVKFEAAVKDVWFSYRMENVLYVPTARRNLFSVTSALDKGMSFNSNRNGCEFVKNGIVKACGVRVGQLFKMAIRVIQPEISPNKEVNLSSKDSLHIWHEKLGHQNVRHVSKLLRQQGIDFVEDYQFCGACVQGKQHRDSFKERQQRAKEPGEIIHADLCGPMECNSLGGAKYFVCFTCDYTRMRMVYFLKEKSETADKVAEVLQIIKTQCGRPMKTFLSDGGNEFNNHEVKELLKSNGVIFAMTNPYTPQQNGCAERTNRTVVDIARTMLLAKHLPKFLWAESVNTAVYILNRTGPSTVEGKTPYELFTGKNVHLNRFHIFGTKCYVHIPKEVRRKWDSKGQSGILVGYSENMDGFRIWLKSKNRVVTSKHVIFEPENVNLLALFPDDTDEQKPNYEDNIVDSKVVGDSVNKQVTDTSSKLVEPNYYLRNRSNLKAPERLIEIMLAEVNEPISYSEAIKSEERIHWKAAMEEEMTSLEENSTWTLVELPENRKSISNRWVFRVKRNQNNEIVRYKARLVVRGFSQREGIDYSETFSPVARFDTIRTVLSIAANERLQLAQFDVKTAFLNGIIDEDIYMDQPEGFEDGTDRVCKLQRSLYGLKQSPRCWNKRFTDVLVHFGLSESTADPCLFYNISGNDKLIIVIYVDDGLVAATKQVIIDKFLSKLRDEFQITVDPVGCFLNMLITQLDDGSIVISQRSYAEGILRRFNMHEANAVSTPVERGQFFGEASNTNKIYSQYREAIGCLMYLAVVTRPDIAFIVSYLSQFLEKSQEKHWGMVKRVMKYIKGTTTLGIRYNSAENGGELEAYSDADYASDTNTRRSVSGVVFKYSGGAIVWTSKRQHCVSLSTTEAEYIAACEAAKDAVWLGRLFNEIAPLKDVPVLFVDNASAIKLTKNPSFHKRSKHIDVRFHFVREQVQEGNLKIQHVCSNDQIADILTKPVSNVRLIYLRNLLGMMA